MAIRTLHGALPGVRSGTFFRACARASSPDLDENVRNPLWIIAFHVFWLLRRLRATL
jgi:hypothetical protein